MRLEFQKRSTHRRYRRKEATITLRWRLKLKRKELKISKTERPQETYLKEEAKVRPLLVLPPSRLFRFRGVFLTRNAVRNNPALTWTIRLRRHTLLLTTNIQRSYLFFFIIILSLFSFLFIFIFIFSYSLSLYSCLVWFEGIMFSLSISYPWNYSQTDKMYSGRTL